MKVLAVGFCLVGWLLKVTLVWWRRFGRLEVLVLTGCREGEEADCQHVLEAGVLHIGAMEPKLCVRLCWYAVCCCL